MLTNRSVPRPCEVPPLAITECLEVHEQGSVEERTGSLGWERPAGRSHPGFPKYTWETEPQIHTSAKHSTRVAQSGVGGNSQSWCPNSPMITAALGGGAVGQGV